MDRKEFCAAVANLRSSIVNCCTVRHGHAELDTIVKIVLGEPEMDIKNSEADLVEHIAGHIKNLKAAKEEDALKEKAVKIIDQIKVMLED